MMDNVTNTAIKKSKKGRAGKVKDFMNSSKKSEGIKTTNVINKTIIELVNLSNT